MLRPATPGLFLGLMLGTSHGRERDPAKQHLLLLNERADRLAARGRSGEPCFLLHRSVYTIGEDEPEIAVERCGWCRRAFSSPGASSIREKRCRLQDGGRQAFECRKCGVRLARHFGRQDAWPTNNTA